MSQIEQGFTLIEMMITVAIIGILAAVAIPAYSVYIAKSETAAALYEITPSRAQFEVRINDGQTAFSVADVGLLSTSDRCSSITVDYEPSTGAGSVTCIMKGSPPVIDRTIAVARASSGRWSCITGQGTASTPLNNDFKPKGCL